MPAICRPRCSRNPCRRWAIHSPFAAFCSDGREDVRYTRLKDGGRLSSSLSASRGQLDQDRLQQEGLRVDEAVEGRQGDRPCRDPGGLASGRCAAHHVRQGFPQRPRLGHGPGARRDLAGPVRLGLPQPRLRDLPDRHSSRQRRQAACPDNAGAAGRTHAVPFRRANGHLRADGGRFQQARSLRQEGGARRRPHSST